MVSASKKQDENDPANPTNGMSTDAYQVEKRDRIARERSAPEVVDLTTDDLEDEPVTSSMGESACAQPASTALNAGNRPARHQIKRHVPRYGIL
jgi:hypothetical protein